MSDDCERCGGENDTNEAVCQRCQDEIDEEVRAEEEEQDDDDDE